MQFKCMFKVLTFPFATTREYTTNTLQLACVFVIITQIVFIEIVIIMAAVRDKYEPLVTSIVPIQRDLFD